MSAVVATMKAELSALGDKRDAIEEEISALAEVLNSPTVDGNPGAGLKGKLVDDEGFPRADIDIYAVRTQRHRVNCLQTDHKLIMKEIETLLPKVLAEARAQALAEPVPVSPPTVSPTSSNTTPQEDESESEPLIAFAEIDQVFKGSPAEEAGVEVGDRLLAFGPVRGVAALPLPELTDLVPIVQGNENEKVVLEIERSGDKRVTLELTPKRWSGAGLLGCHLIKLR